MKSIMRKQFMMGLWYGVSVVLFLSLALVSSQTRAQNEQKHSAKPISVVASHPLVYGLLSLLAKDTLIVPTLATPDGLPVGRHSSYLSGRGAKSLERLANKAEAVVTIRSIWPEDPLYPLIRRHNIRVIEIDAANPVDRQLPGIALSSNAHNETDYPWLNPINMGRMADIIGAELKRLAPEARVQIEHNRAHIKQALLQLTAQTEAALVGMPDVSIISLSPRLTTWAEAFNLEFEVFVPGSRGWSEGSIAELISVIKAKHEPVLLLTQATLPPELTEALQSTSAKVLPIQTEGGNPIVLLQQASVVLRQSLAEFNQ